MCSIGRALRASINALVSCQQIDQEIGIASPLFSGGGWNLDEAERYVGERFSMRRNPVLAIAGSLLLILTGLLLMDSNLAAKDKKGKPSVCSSPHPEQLCTAANICGSSNSPCLLEIRRVGGGVDASVTPNIPNFPKDSVICITTGTNVTWRGEGKNTGIMVDFGDSSPSNLQEQLWEVPIAPLLSSRKKPVAINTRSALVIRVQPTVCVGIRIFISLPWVVGRTMFSRLPGYSFLLANFVKSRRGYWPAEPNLERIGRRGKRSHAR